MSLTRYTRYVDGSIPIEALLYGDEELLSSQDGVGIYDGVVKSPNHQSGTVHITTHRLFFISNGFGHSSAELSSFALDLGLVDRTDYYAGLFTSSSKATLYLSAPVDEPGSSNRTNGGPEDTVLFESWECEICAYRNPPGLSPAAARICGLCGVPRESVPSPTPIAAPSAILAKVKMPTSPNISTSLPSSSPLASRAILEEEERVNEVSSTVACPACTFLNHPSMHECEICGGALPKPSRSGQLRPQTMKSAPSSRPQSAAGDGSEEAKEGMIKLSFRKGGDKPFYAALKRSLQGKAWKAAGIGKGNSNASSAAQAGGSRKFGVDAVLSNISNTAQTTESDMSSALYDLEALMVKAKDMVRLSEELNDRLTAITSTTSSTDAASAFNNPSSSSALSTHYSLDARAEPEEATFIRSSLAQLGLSMPNAPVTQAMVKDEHKWTEELARELTSVLQGSNNVRPTATGKKHEGIMRERGIVALDEIWGAWNRARGIELIPPSTFLTVIPLVTTYTSPPILHRTFASGLSVLHTPPYTSTAFAARLVGLLGLAGPRTTAQIAVEERITIGLAEEMMMEVEQNGDVLRDEGPPGSGGVGDTELLWWPNVWSEYVWDGQK